MYQVSRESWETGDGVKTPLTKDVAFNRKSFGLTGHASPYDNKTVQVGVDGIEVRLIQGIDEDNLKKVLTAAEMATIGLTIEELDDIAGGAPDEGNEMFKGGLQTALESQVIVFGVKGASRTCTHQLVRSRRAAFHQQSQRASHMGSWPEVRMPESIWNGPFHVVKSWLNAYRHCALAYQDAIEADHSYQDARFILPEGTCNFIMLEYPIREFLAVYAYRACSMFQWEICYIMRECKKVLVAEHPWIEPYVKISCEVTQGAIDVSESRRKAKGFRDEDGVWHEDLPETNAHHCTFQGWESVDKQCDFPWARDSNRSFQPQLRKIEKR